MAAFNSLTPFAYFGARTEADQVPLAASRRGMAHAEIMHFPRDEFPASSITAMPADQSHEGHADSLFRVSACAPPIVEDCEIRVEGRLLRAGISGFNDVWRAVRAKPEMVEQMGIKPTTSSLRTKRSIN